jgi:putative hydrolase of the HAD superfamily
LKIKAVIFDLDNTLIDFMKMKREATKAAAWAMVDAGLSADRADLSSKLFDFYLNYDIESDDAFSKFLMKTYKTVDYRVLAAAVNAYLREKALHLKPYPAVVETLTALKKRGFMLAVVTDGLRLKAWRRLNAAGLDKYFDVVVTYDDTGKKKPHEKPFKKAISGLRVKPQECLMVGDWVIDMQNNNETPPSPLSSRSYSGKFVVRVPPEVHRELALKAAEEGISLNRLISSKLSNLKFP